MCYFIYSAIDIKDLKILKTCEQVLQEKVQSIADRKPPKVTIGADGKIANKNGFAKARTPQKNSKNTPQKSDNARNNNTPKKGSEHQNGRTPKGKMSKDNDAVDVVKTSTSKKGGASCKKLFHQQNGGMENGHGMNKENRDDGDVADARRRHPSAGVWCKVLARDLPCCLINSRQAAAFFLRGSPMGQLYTL